MTLTLRCALLALQLLSCSPLAVRRRIIVIQTMIALLVPAVVRYLFLAAVFEGVGILYCVIY